MTRLALTLAVAATVLLPATGARGQCATSTFIEVPVPGVGTLYYDDRGDYPPVPGALTGPDGTFIYLESDGSPGLNPGGGNVIERTTGFDLPSVFDDPCGEGDGDMLIGKSCAAVPVFYGIEAPTCLSG